jgi:SAM-dependent methyltransferase
MPYHNPPEICPVCKEKADFKFIQDYESKEGKWSLYECSKCQVQFWMPFKNPSAQQYEEDVDYTTKLGILTKENCWLIVRDYWNMSQFLKNLPYKNPKGKKILDLGCGTGEFLFVVKNLGYEAYGVDFNEKAINIAKNLLGIENVYSDDVLRFLEDKKEEYDVITAFEIIEHLNDPKKLLELVYQALKPGGYFALSLPNRERYFGRIDPKIESWDFPYQHLTRWNLNSLKRFIKTHGFEIVITKKEIPISWFVSRVRLLIELFFKKNKESKIGPVEQIRSDIGLKRYKLIKSLLKFITYPLAFLLFYGLKFEGAGLYLLAKKK